MFFKAGAHTGNNSSPYPERDFDLVTFYKLETSHEPSPKGAWIEKLIKEEKARTKALMAEGTPPHPAVEGIIMDDSFTDAIDQVAQINLAENGGRPAHQLRLTSNPENWGSFQVEQVEALEQRLLRKLYHWVKLFATFTFNTGKTVGFDRQDAFRIGLHDRLQRPELETDLSASSGAPNETFNGLPGYMVTFDVNRNDPP